jgi:hypothetical protein
MISQLSPVSTASDAADAELAAAGVSRPISQVEDSKKATGNVFSIMKIACPLLKQIPCK